MKTRLLRKRRDPPPHPVLRGFRMAGGALLVLVGIVLALPTIPGPGTPLVLVGLWLLSADVRLARRALTWLRIEARRLRRRYENYRRVRTRAG